VRKRRGTPQHTPSLAFNSHQIQLSGRLGRLADLFRGVSLGDFLLDGDWSYLEYGAVYKDGKQYDKFISSVVWFLLAVRLAVFTL